MRSILVKTLWIFFGFALLLLFQYQLWFQSSGIFKMKELGRQLTEYQVMNKSLREKNELIAQDVERLKKDPRQIESEAREGLGMIKKGEKFYRIYQQEHPYVSH